jgi:putative endonuclease
MFFSKVELPQDRTTIGQIGETAACSYLEKKGLRFLKKNWKCKIGEIDLVMLDGRELVFVEVKTRLESRFAVRSLFFPITEKKKQKLRNLALLYTRGRSCVEHDGFRIDAVGVVLARESLRVLYIEHLPAAL